jgi:hypothetical protein
MQIGAIHIARSEIDGHFQDLDLESSIRISFENQDFLLSLLRLGLCWKDIEINKEAAKESWKINFGWVQPEFDNRT